MKRALSVIRAGLLCLLVSDNSLPMAVATQPSVRNGCAAAQLGEALQLQESSPPNDESRLRRFESALNKLRLRYKIPGLSAAIVNGGQIRWQRGFGFQDVENRIPATPETPYLIASLTKTFASMLLMKCVEQGTLDLDRLISNYTAGIPEASVTVRHLFTHTSENPPGTNYRYNGNRYSYLTSVVDACAGIPFREVLARTILDRLNMLDSVPGQDLESPAPAVAAQFNLETLQRYARVIQRLARPYTTDRHGKIVLSAYPYRGLNAAAGMISTVRDLALYDGAIDSHTLLKAQTQEVAWTNAVSNQTGQKLPYGLGWFVQKDRGESLIWHYGQWGGSFSALIMKVPGRNVTLLLLANSDGLSAPFSSLGLGNVTGSPFASLFLHMLEDPTAFKVPGSPRGQPAKGTVPLTETVSSSGNIKSLRRTN